MYHKGAIESYPLQTYASVLLFSPTGSLVKQLFQHEEPKGITIKPAISDNWSTCLQTLEGHSGGVNSVAFSQNSSQLASASSDTTIKIWDASSGACLQTLEGHRDCISSVAFSHDGAQLASGSDDRTVKVWDISTGACLQTLEGHGGQIRSVAFSRDGAQLASGSDDRTVKVWDISTGACLQTLEVGKNLEHLFFNSSGSALYSEIGTIFIQSPNVSSVRDAIESEPPLPISVGLSSDDMWITYNGNKILWLPSEYRPWHSSVRGNMIGIAVGSRRVWICHVDL